MAARTLRPALAILLLAASLGGATAQTYAPTYRSDSLGQQALRGDKILVTGKSLPPSGAYEVIESVWAYSRWFGNKDDVIRMLREQARSLGANAIVETGTWYAPAFPRTLAPHAAGIAVRIREIELLEAMTDSSSTWE
ncbi:hypothetical protein [Quatrionicoccus australiensis]|uniref:hypothetical protein n=1 Tax=Quatrionicoccus australiensis TaxID=138118 RepID=UPI001CF85AB9|nr:hypothetical protein [Quatrionicoccus australiensis]UCV16630.1 hypothetical protein KI612_08035 [Quatrionicoccus australiensis]